MSSTARELKWLRRKDTIKWFKSLKLNYPWCFARKKPSLPSGLSIQDVNLTVLINNLTLTRVDEVVPLFTLSHMFISLRV